MLKGINPGRLDILLTVEQRTSALNSIGENEYTWSSYKQMKGSRSWKGSGEVFEAMQEVGGDNVEVMVRYDSGLTTTMRFTMGQDTTYFYIRNIQQWQREGYSLISASRRDNQ